MTDFSTFRAEADRVYSQLREYLAEVTGAVMGWRRYVTPDSALSGWDTALRTAQRELSDLAPDGSLTLAVISGERPLATWNARADTVRAQLEYLANETETAIPTWERIRDELVMPTVKDVAAEVKGATGVALDYLPWVVAGIIALVLGYLAFIFLR